MHSVTCPPGKVTLSPWHCRTGWVALGYVCRQETPTLLSATRTGLPQDPCPCCSPAQHAGCLLPSFGDPERRSREGWQGSLRHKEEPGGAGVAPNRGHHSDLFRTNVCLLLGPRAHTGFSRPMTPRAPLGASFMGVGPAHSPQPTATTGAGGKRRLSGRSEWNFRRCGSAPPWPSSPSC